MRRPFPVVPVVLVGAFALTLSVVHADTLTAPASIMAQQDGSFSFSVTFHKGPGSGQFAGYSYFGEVNVLGGLYADCFCLESCPTFTEGQTFTFTVEGQLTDPGIPGRVAENFALCSAGGASASTEIRNYSVTGVGATPFADDARFWNEPNPFATRTTFHYRLAEAGPVRLAIYDPAGRLVARVVDEVQSAGPHEAVWDVGGQLPGSRAAGVLFARLTRPGSVRNRALIVAR